MSTVRQAVVAALMQLASPTGSGYNEDWTIKVKSGYIYHGFEFETNLKNPDTIKKITVDIGGTPVIYPTAKILDLFDKFYGVEQTQGRIVLDLSKFDMRSPAGVYITALATAFSEDITITIELGSRHVDSENPSNSDPEVPTLKGKAYMTENPAANLSGGGRRSIPIKYDLTQYVAASGRHDWTFPSGAANRFVQRMVFDESETQISRVTLKRGQKTIREMTRSDIDSALKRRLGVKLQPGYLLLDFLMFGFGANDAISTQGLNFEFEVSGAGAIKTHIDGFDVVA